MAVTVFKFTCCLLLFVCVLCGCTPVHPLPPLTTAALTATTTIPTPFSSPLPPLSATPELPDTGWHSLQPGFERRLIKLYNGQNQHIESLYLWRLDQAYFRLEVAHQETARSLESWQEGTNAFLVVNGGFYRKENESYFPNGLTVVNGQASGSSYVGFGGMLAVREHDAELRSLAERPYDPSESLQFGLQSFPILVKPGGVLGFPAESEDHIKARRTVIAQDTDGRILFLVAPRGDFTLHQLSLYLTSSDLHLHIAINLDGGPSTGILVSEPPEIIPSQTLLPFVILVYPR